MGFVYAKNNGNWSDTTTWAGGILPVTGDEVYTNGYTVDMDQDVDLLLISNDIAAIGVPRCDIPRMTSTSLPSGSVISSGDVIGNEDYRIFDKEIITLWRSTIINGGWIGYVFPTAKTIKQYSFLALSTTYGPEDWTFEGSNDGISWTVLDTVTGNNSGSFYSGVISNTTSYTHYRINITLSIPGNQQPRITFFDMTENTDTAQGYKYYGLVTVPASRNINFSGEGLKTYNGTVLRINSVNGDTVNITTVGGGTLIGVNQQRIQADATICQIINDPIVNISSDLYGIGRSILYSVGYTRNGLLRMYGPSTVNIIGNIYGSNNTNASYDCPVIQNGGVNSTLTITGNLIGSSVAKTYSVLRCYGTSSTNSIIGNIEGSVGNCVYIAGTNIDFNHIGTIRTLSSDCLALIIDDSKTTVPGIIRVTSPIINYQGSMAIATSTLKFYNTANIQWTVQDDLGVDKVLTNAGGSSGVPLESDVRNGVTYGAASGLTGTLLLPAASDVRVNVPFDNTFGTADLTAQDFFTAIATSNDPIAIRMRNMSTIQTTASTVASFDV